VSPLKEPFGRGTLVFEVLSTPERLHYLFSFPPDLKQTMQGKLTGAIRDIGLEETTVKLDYNWQCGVQLRRDSLMRDPDAKDPYKQRPVDPKLVEGLLRSTRGLGEGEAVIIQFVMTPTGRLRYDKYPEFWAVGRIAACATHQDKKARRTRARQLVDDTLSSYRTLYVFSPGLVPGRLASAFHGVADGSGLSVKVPS
jgi:hypothetical protein